MEEHTDMAAALGDSSLSALVASCFDGLGTNPDIDRVEQCISQFTQRFQGADPARRTLAVNDAKKRLKTAGVPDAGEALDAALGSQTIRFLPADPVEGPVDGEFLCDWLYEAVRQYVVLDESEAVAIVLWIVHTYCVSGLSVSPILWISSPVKRCGKTTLVMVVGALAHRVISTSNITPAALFRLMDRHAPTLQIDEADTKFGAAGGNEELRSILNAGHTRLTAKVIRAVPGPDGGYEPREYSVFGPKVVAGIGRLPSTVEDRSIPIALRRSTRTDRVDRLRADRISDEHEELRGSIARWSLDNLDALKDLDPELPEGLHDRARDNWRPLIAIADLVGGPWKTRARKAALALSREDATDDVNVVLLGDLRELFESADKQFLPTKQILSALHARDDRPWADWKEGQPITDVQFARLLRPFGVRPGEHREGEQVLRGYHRGGCRDAFSRYLPPP
jgi:putative DNA primase/helicase